MNFRSVYSIVEKLPESDEKKRLKERLERLERDAKKTEELYIKTNEDKLTLSQLLNKVNKELEESLANEKRFIASVSHELRTPLTAILGYGELMHDTILNNKQKKYLNNIMQSSEHLLALINDLLDVSKLEDNRIELSMKEFDMDNTLTECANLIRSKINDNVEFITDIPLLDYSVISDEKRVKQIIINLLSNAAKFTKQGSIRFYVKSIEELPNDKVKFVINVDDTGGGIPKKIASLLFEPFHSTDKTQGTGLGLYISRQLAKMMDGDITVTSEDGIGSSFSVTLVVKKAKEQKIGERLKDAHIMMFAPQSEFIDRISREFILHNASFQNHNIKSIDTTSALVQMIAIGQFYDIAIFDLGVFNKHTDHIAGTLKVINPDIKLVAYSQDGEEHTISGFDKIIDGPISYRRFVKEIESVYAEDFYEQNIDEDNYSNLEILIVEDVELNREYEKEMLNNFFNIICDTAVNGKEAVEMAKKKKYDVILMDMRMPVMDGLEATKEIRKFDPDIPIICMSANVYKEDKMAAEEAGMNDFIEKPLEKKDIESRLIKLINKEFEPKKIQEKKDQKSNTSEQSRQPAPQSGKELKNIAIKQLKSNFSDEIANKLISKAAESIVGYINSIKKNFQAKDIRALVEDYHALKGVCANVGLTEQAKQAEELQKLAEQGSLVALHKPTENLLKELRSFVEEIR